MATHFPLGKRAMATLRSFKLRGKTVYQFDLGFDVLGKRIRKIYSVRKDAQKALKDFEKNQKKGDLCGGPNRSPSALPWRHLH
jgi:hypothetical protein